jgi:peptide deformylase
MNLIENTSPLLTTECYDFNFDEPPFDIIEFSKELVKFMYDNNGIGLAANQVGIPYRIFAMRGYPENFVCVNPRIVNFSSQEIALEEGCLSFPNLVVKIKRPKEIRVRFQTPNGETITRMFDGMTARVFQHELDHLNGIIFYKRANRFHREKALKKMESYNV